MVSEKGFHIRAALLEKGITLRSIAKKLNVSPAHVSQVVHGKYASKRLRKAIAEAIGVPVTSIWPDQKKYPPPGRKNPSAVGASDGSTGGGSFSINNSPYHNFRPSGDGRE